jgi:hypothetical protein
MTCHRVTSENLIERYVQGKLDPGLRDDFENHYFECESCLAFLQTVQTIHPVLAAMPPPVLAKRRAPLLPWLGLAAAAALVIVLIFWQKPSPNSVAALPPPAPAALLLSEIRPAPYSPALFRDGAAGPGPAFETAMRLYQNRRWKDAAEALAMVARTPPSNPAALHFAGISHLLASQPEAALAALDRVIAVGSNSPFEEEARFYRAQALLLTGRLPEARQELDRVIQAKGDYEAQARSLRSRF